MKELFFLGNKMCAYTLDSPYIAVIYNLIKCTAQHLQLWNFKQTLHSWMTPHTSPSRARYYWVIWRKITVIYRERIVCTIYNVQLYKQKLSKHIIVCQWKSYICEASGLFLLFTIKYLCYILTLVYSYCTVSSTLYVYRCILISVIFANDTPSFFNLFFHV